VFEGEGAKGVASSALFKPAKRPLKDVSGTWWARVASGLVAPGYTAAEIREIMEQPGAVAAVESKSNGNHFQ
jgi:hypothetical protein